MSAVPVKFTADPVSYLLASWRFGQVSRFVCGKMGFQLERSGKEFKCRPCVDLRDEPWSQARSEQLENGIWMLHAENPVEGVGFFLRESDAKFSMSKMKVNGFNLDYGLADMRYLDFLRPLWPTIDKMEQGFWEDPISGWEDQFSISLKLMLDFVSARQLYALVRLRNKHPLQ